MNGKSWQWLKLTLKLQPVIMVYTLVSVCSKLASRQLAPRTDESHLKYALGCVMNFKLIGLLSAMVLLLGLYAVIWQRVIKDAKLSVIYANKGAAVFWGQIAAVLLFSEHIGLNNILGILVIFAGILLANSDIEKE